jgi:hypothetical protein
VRQTFGGLTSWDSSLASSLIMGFKGAHYHKFDPVARSCDI